MVSAHEQSSNNYTMPKDVLSNGGDKSNSSNYQMVATVGQYATQKVAANGSTLYSGFYAPRSTRDSKQKPTCGGITDGLVACYPFDGDANDASGNGNHGTENGVIEYIEGKVNQAIKLNGNSSYVKVINPEQKFDKQYTITAWVSTQGRGMPFFAKYSWNGSARGFAVHSTTPDGNGVTTNGSTLFSVAMYNESWNPKKFPTYTLPINKFKHVSATYNEGEAKLYIDGILVDESTVQHQGTLDNPYDILMGAYWHNQGKSLDHNHTRTFDGLIDDLRIYNRALTEAEIKQLYNGTEPCEPELSVQPLYRVLQWWQVQTPFELQDKTACGDMNWTTKANQPWLSVSPTSGTDDASLNVMMYPSWWFNVGTFTTTAPDAIGSPANNLVIQPGLWWWWRYWVMQLFSGTIHPNQVIPHIIGINQMMWGPMIFKVTWPGSDLDLKITTPSGKVLTKDSPEVLQVHQGDTEEYWVVQSQEQGDWQVEVVAIEVDAEGEAYQLEIIANERTTPPTEDTDGDGLPDEWEIYFLGDLTQEGTGDSDNDGVANLQEFQQQLNPVSKDTDGDGELDGDEIAIAPASCQLYAVHDKGVNDTQFFTVNLENLTVTPLGPLYKNHDIEALAVHPETNMLYAAAGDKATDGKPGDFYRVDGQTGELFPIGGTGFTNIEDLAFSPEGSLYAWAKGDGLITIDLTTGQGTLVLASQETQIEGLTLKKEAGLVFLGAVGTDLWQYDSETKMLEILCPNRLLGETEALEITSDGILLIGTHKVPFGLHTFDVQTCQVIQADESLSNQFDDVEGIALPIAACAK
jgi:hypothetical protein